MTSRPEISQWFDDGVAKGATHMIVACDCYSWDDYPSYVMPGEDPKEKEKEILDHGMQIQKKRRKKYWTTVCKRSWRSIISPWTKIRNFDKGERSITEVRYERTSDTTPSPLLGSKP